MEEMRINEAKPRRTILWGSFAALCVFMLASNGPRVASAVEWMGAMFATLGIGAVFAAIKTLLLTRKREERDFLGSLAWSAWVVAIFAVGNAWTR